MAKKSQRRSVRHERDQSGCMWGLISIFDFRHGRTTQKLLSDRRRGTRHVAAAGKATNRPDLLINLDENCQDNPGGEESTVTAVDTVKPSVKKLMEEEMLCEKDSKKEIYITEAEQKQSNLEEGGDKKKSRKRTNRSRTKSCEIYIEDLDADENLKFEKPDLQNSEKQSTNNLDMEVGVEELCHHIQRISSTKHGQHEEIYNKPKQKDPDFEEKLSEVIKLFISQRLPNGKHVTGTSDIHPSEELKDALKFLCSNEELALELLQGPKSVMVKYVENLCNALMEKRNLSEEEVRNLKQSDQVMHRKQRNFFRKKAKSVDKNPSKGAEASQSSNTIVILKPSPVESEKPNAEGSQEPTPESAFSNKGSNERVSSHFFLTEIKRRLKQAMRKEQQEIPPDGVLKRFLKEQTKADRDKRYKDTVGRNSLSKDHFFIEKIVKQGEKTDKLKGCEISKDNGTAIYPRQRLSNIYIEAKKHLSEMFSSGTGDAGFSNRQVPKTLGRILSLPEYNFSPIGSPGRDWGQSLDTPQTRLSTNDKFHKQENNASHIGRMSLSLETELFASVDSTKSKAEVSSNRNSSVINDLVRYNETEETTCSIGGDGMTLEGNVDVVKETEILIQEDSNIMDKLFEPSDSASTKSEQNADIPKISDSKGYSECSEHDLHVETQPPPSILTSPSTPSVNKKVDDHESAIEVSERRSPVSVLEPLFIEEDVSPASIRSQPAELSMQPLRIQFEEHDLSAADLGTDLKVCIEDKESVFEFLKAVLQASELNWDEFYIMSSSLDPLLDPSVFDEVYEHYFGFPLGLSFAKSTIRLVPDMKNVIHEVWNGVSWYLLPLPLPHTLEQIVKKDMAKNGTWMDMRCDSEAMIIKIGEAIFKDLMEETVLSCANESSENGNSLIPVGLKDEKTIDS